MGSQQTFQVPRRHTSLQQPLTYYSNEIFGQEGVCKHKIPNLVGIGPQRQDDLGSHSLQN